MSHSKSVGSFTRLATKSSVVSRWCTCTVMHVSTFVRSFLDRLVLVVMVIRSRSMPSAVRRALAMTFLSLRAAVRPACTSAVHANCRPSRLTCAGWLKMNVSSSWSMKSAGARLMFAFTVFCMPFTRACSHASMLPCASTGLSTIVALSAPRRTSLTVSPVEECMASILVLSALSNVTVARESNRPLWKWCCTAAGSEPRERISRRVGSDTK